jgi:hypothetical protein
LLRTSVRILRRSRPRPNEITDSLRAEDVGAPGTLESLPPQTRKDEKREYVYRLLGTNSLKVRAMWRVL